MSDFFSLYFPAVERDNLANFDSLNFVKCHYPGVASPKIYQTFQFVAGGIDNSGQIVFHYFLTVNFQIVMYWPFQSFVNI